MRTLITIILALFIIQTQCAFVDWNYYFYGGTETEKNWVDGANWNTSSAPTSNDDVSVDQLVGTSSIAETYTIYLPQTLTIKSLNVISGSIYIFKGSGASPSTVNIGTLKCATCLWGNVALTVTGNSDITGYLYLNGGSIINNGNMSTYSITLKGTSSVTNNNELHLVGEYFKADQTWAEGLATNNKFTNNGKFYVQNDVRMNTIEIEQTSSGSLIVDMPKDRSFWYQGDAGGAPQGYDHWNGAPSKWSGLFQVRSGIMFFYGGTITFTKDVTIDIWANGQIIFEALDYFQTDVTFESNLTLTNPNMGLFSLGSSSITRFNGDTQIYRLDFQDGTITGTGKQFDVTILSCGSANNKKFKSISGKNVTVTGTFSLDYCDTIGLDNNGALIIAPSSTVSVTNSIIDYNTRTEAKTGRFINYGTYIVKPQASSSGPHTWYVPFVNFGTLKCIYSDFYDHCVQFQSERGNFSYNYGVIDINSKAQDYLQNFGKGWAPTEIGGPWKNYNPKGWQRASLYEFYGPIGCTGDANAQKCRQDSGVYFYPAGQTYNFSTLRFDIRIYAFVEANINVTDFDWSGGYIGAKGTINILGNARFSDSQYGGADTIRYLDGNTVNVYGTLNVDSSLFFVNGGNVVIKPSGTLLISGTLGSHDDKVTYSNLWTSEGRIQVNWGNFGSKRTGSAKIVNKGLLDFSDSYIGSSDIPELIFEQYSEFYLESTSNLSLRIRGPDDGNSDMYKYADTISLIYPVYCKFGGVLSITFTQPVGCFPTCPEFIPKAGDQFRIFSLSTASNNHNECYGSFSRIDAYGLPSGLKLGIKYNVPNDYQPSYPSVAIVVCASSAATCGDSSNPIQPPKITTTKSGTPSSNGNGGSSGVNNPTSNGQTIDTNTDGQTDTSSSSIFVIISMLLLVLLF